MTSTTKKCGRIEDMKRSINERRSLGQESDGEMNIKPGRELDTLVADKIFGLTMRDRYTGKEVPITLDQLLMSGSALRIMNLPRYSTDIGAAFEVVKKLQETAIVEVSVHKGDWSCSINRSGNEVPDYFASADTAPHAICLAALKAVGVDLASLG